MPDRTFLDWPFFDARHRTMARQAADWWRREGATLPSGSHDPRPADPSHAGSLAEIGGDVWTACREIVRRLGDAGWLRHVVPAAYAGEGGAGAADEGSGAAGATGADSAVGAGAGQRGSEPASPDGGAGGLDVRSLCLLRETFAYGSALADFAFALQGLGSGPLSLFGSDEQRRRYLPAVAAGRAIPAFALSEAGAGSDVTAMRTTARRDGADYVLDGEKTWISNAGIADFYIVFCRLPAGGEKSFAAFVVDAGHPGLRVTERLDVIAPHPLGTLVFAGCRVPAGALVGEPGRGLRVALATLDVFRATVGAAALGLARRALDEALDHARHRQVSGQLLGAHQLTQAKLADMATAIDASALLVYRAAWTRDRGAARVTREAAMAKLFATEAAQRVIDDAVQLLGARGVLAGAPVERLYREVRALRIYEGTSEIQRLVIAGQLLAPAADERAHRAEVQALAQEPPPAADPEAALAHESAATARDQASAADPGATLRGEAAGGPATPASSSASTPRAVLAQPAGTGEPAADASVLVAEGSALGPSTPERRPA